MTQPSSPAAATSPAIAISADHGGYRLKSFILSQHDAHMVDLGTRNDTERVDVQDYAMAVVKAIYDGYVDRGIVICRSGQMASIVANRYSFIRAALCHSPAEAEAARGHLDANVLCLPADYIDDVTALATVRAFMAGKPDPEPRYAHRLAKLAALDMHEFDPKPDAEG